MQDRLKFRVWDKDAKEYLTLYEEDEKTGMHNYWIGWDNTGVYKYDRDVERDIVFITDISQFVELEQCTGLTDKNGRLIYEGDIVRQISKREPEYEEYITEVKWCVFGYPLYDEESFDYEVIGNIHENPDLVEA